MIILYKYYLQKSIDLVRKYQKIVLTDIFELHIIELPKLEKAFISGKIERENRKLATWCKFLINPDNMEEEEMQENEDIKKAKEELEKMRMDEYEERIAELRMKAIMDEKSGRNYEYNRGKQEGIEKGIEKGKKEGIKQGEKVGKTKIARKLLKLNMKIDEIVKITELSRDDIEKIKLQIM